MATQPTNPVAGTQAHPNTSAPPGTKLCTAASVQRSDASGPYLVYSRPARGYEAASSRTVQVPVAVAQADLAWMPAGETTCRLATDQEVTDSLAAKQAAYEASTRRH